MECRADLSSSQNNSNGSEKNSRSILRKTQTSFIWSRTLNAWNSDGWFSFKLGLTPDYFFNCNLVTADSHLSSGWTIMRVTGSSLSWEKKTYSELSLSYVTLLFRKHELVRKKSLSIVLQFSTVSFPILLTMLKSCKEKQNSRMLKSIKKWHL